MLKRFLVRMLEKTNRMNERFLVRMLNLCSRGSLKGCSNYYQEVPDKDA